MGRRENAVAAGTRQLEALALWLRAQRQRKGISYATMAKTIDYQFTASVLSRAANGHTVPSWRLVEAYTSACDAEADTTEALRLWKAARWAEENRRRRGGTPQDFRDLAATVDSALTHPQLIESFGQLRHAMIQLRAKEGQPSLSALQHKAGRTPNGRHHRLPKSSLSAILRGEAIPSREHVTAFMETMGQSRRKVQRWEMAWDRIAEKDTAPPPTRTSRRHLVPHETTPPTHTARTPEAVVIRIQEAPITAHSTPGARAAGDLTLKFVTPGDFGYLRIHGPQTRKRARLTRTWLRPQPPLPPAGYTRAGLPIRNPRRYGPAFTDNTQPPSLTPATPHGPGVPVPALVKPPAVDTIPVKHVRQRRLTPATEPTGGPLPRPGYATRR
ncbi:helix-turn-helix domain-containing protein [Streptomyces sp. NBC_01142]|uniref:helix-turn-helix domain-containing protein n=1 Tax=Streptomyces sp. NBC_01142 TaxID=2975865 RepID=UPI00225307BA|nr:transcriptional regulator [Streptomyces sp. NBC_01142]MCX4826007.1 helix-turn-helix domain-containing protein [Streptomyces sp. NBC_01142]